MFLTFFSQTESVDRVTGVEQVPVTGTLQFSTSVELKVNIVSWLVGWLRKVLEFGSKDFLAFAHEVRPS